MTGIVLKELKLEQAVPVCRDYRWIQVQTETGILEAVDPLGCREGMRALLVSAKAAGAFCMGCPGDWCVAAVLEEPGNNG